MPRLPILTPLLVALLAGVPATPPGAAAVHPHYSRLLRQGVFALEQGDPAEAARDLELACFGLLEEPPRLAQCLVYLGLAQEATDDVQGFRDTFRRLVEVEERFGGYRAAELPAGVRTELEGAIARRIGERTLRYAGPFSRLAGETEPATGATSPDGGDAVTPRPPEEPAAGAGARRPAASTEAERPQLEGLDSEDRARLDRARELLAEAVTRADLEEPYRLALEVAEEHPGSRRAEHLTAVIAYRSARWEEAVRHFRRGGELAPDDAEGMFYFAVSLYESGERVEAAEVLRRSLPGLEQTAFVRSYREKILGSPTAGDDGGGSAPSDPTTER